MTVNANRRRRIGGKRRPRHAGTQSPPGNRLLDFLSGQERPLTAAAITRGMGLPRTAKGQVRELLGDLVRSGKVRKQNNRFQANGAADEMEATLELTARGFGFAVPTAPGVTGKDIYIAPPNLGTASQGDTVLVRITGRSRGRREGRVVKVLHRAISRLCGIYTRGGKTGFVTPDNDRLPYTVLIRQKNAMNAEDGVAVLVEITDYGTEQKGPEGRIIEILGDPYSVNVQIRMAIEQFGLQRTFPHQVEQEVARLEPLVECTGDRADLRDVLHVTIDGETARDFDDAICVEQTRRGGYRLYVSIADVSHYVWPGSAIDREAYSRGTSVYLPGQVLPMLPERLSNDLCSLVPNQDRPAFSAILEFDAKGRRIGQRYTKSMIRSHQRFTYDTVHRTVYLEEQEQQQRHKRLVPMLRSARRLADLLHKRRMQRGSLGFTIPEAFITLDDGRIASIGRAERNEAHQMIEEFMLAANEAVAETLEETGEPVLYRIHEYPDPLKVDAFTDAAKALGLQLPPTEISPSWFARVLDEARGTPAEYVVNNLLLRTMQQARYAPENVGHFGLAASHYLHFTSPIRRYPDLVAHRVLHGLLLKRSGSGDPGPVLPAGSTLAEAGVHLSKRERIAIDTERNVQARLSALFLLDRIDEEFDAIISGVTSFGLFVELFEYFISGAIPIRTMKDDYYLFDSNAHRLIGERSNRIYQLGGQVRVRLDHVDMQSKRITFSLVKDQSQGR